MAPWTKKLRRLVRDRASCSTREDVLNVLMLVTAWCAADKNLVQKLQLAVIPLQCCNACGGASVTIVGFYPLKRQNGGIVGEEDADLARLEHALEPNLRVRPRFCARNLAP